MAKGSIEDDLRKMGLSETDIAGVGLRKAFGDISSDYLNTLSNGDGTLTGASIQWKEDGSVLIVWRRSLADGDPEIMFAGGGDFFDALVRSDRRFRQNTHWKIDKYKKGRE